MHGPLNMFLPITKVDAAKRLVFGVATAEREDRAGEVCDYASTKPFYEKWSRGISKATDGKSLGNLRSMHGKVAAGKITALVFHDEAKEIEICAKIVDDAEWDKVCEGVYTGFSQGGIYVNRWTDPDGLKRYTADPSEISLVDLPCLPQATFQMIKTGGEIEEVPFLSGASARSRIAAAKRGARHSAADQAWIQSAHDSLVAAGARCSHSSASAEDGDDDGDGGDLQAMASSRLGAPPARMSKERELLRRDIATLAQVLDEILDGVNKIKSQPNPLPVESKGRAVSKSDDGAADPDPSEMRRLLVEKRQELALEAIRLAHQNPKPLGLRR